jgi:hypothetical protein
MPETSTPKIYAAMSAVMGDIGAVGKTGKNVQQNYAFRGIDDVMTAAHDALVKNGVFYLPKVLQRIPETRETQRGGAMNVMHLEIEYAFYASDGSRVEAVVWGEASDSADKATNKAMSAALKYALVQAFSIGTQDMADGDKDAVEAGPRRGQSASEAFDNATPAAPRNGNANGNATRPPARTDAQPPAKRRAAAKAPADAQTDIDWMGHLVDDLIPAATIRGELLGFWDNVHEHVADGKCTDDHAKEILAMVTSRAEELGFEKAPA